MKQALAIIFIVGFTSVSLIAQKADWFIKPVISDVDKIEINYNQEKFDNLVVVKNGLKGVKTRNNETLVPTEYKHVAFWVRGQYIYMHHEGNEYWLDNEGYEVDGEMVNKKDSKLTQQKSNKRKEEQKAKFESENPNYTFAYNPIKNYKKDNVLINPAGDTICDSFEPSYYFITKDNYALIRRKNTLFAYNDQAELIKEYPKYTSFNKVYEDYAIISSQKKQYLLNSKLESVLPEGKEFAHISEDHKFVIYKEGDLMYLSTMDFEPLNTDGYKSAYFEKESQRFIGKLDGAFETFNPETKTFSRFDLQLKNSYRDGRLYAVKKDTLVGTFDMVEERLLFEPIYKSISKIAPNLYAVYKEKNKKDKVHYVYLMDEAQNIVFEGEMNRIIKLGSEGFMIMLGNVTTLYNANGDLVDTFTDCYIRKQDNFLIYRPKGEKANTLLLSDFMKGDRESKWDRIDKPVNLRAGKGEVYPATRNGKIGFIDKDGNELFPFELDQVDNIMTGDNLMTVKKDNNWGILRFSHD